MSKRKGKVMVINLDNIFISILLFLVAIAVESFTGLELGAGFYVLMVAGLWLLIPSIHSYTYQIQEEDEDAAEKDTHI